MIVAASVGEVRAVGAVGTAGTVGGVGGVIGVVSAVGGAPGVAGWAAQAVGAAGAVLTRWCSLSAEAMGRRSRTNSVCRHRALVHITGERPRALPINNNDR